MRQHVQQLGAARAEYEARRAQWSEKRIEAESLGRAVERFRQEERTPPSAANSARAMNRRCAFRSHGRGG